jgi:septum formation protein
MTSAEPSPPPAPAPRLILASRSASRRAMLDAAGIAHVAEPADVDEAAIKQQLLAEQANPPAIALRLAEEKAATVVARHPAGQRLHVIGSDSVVSVDGRLFDKPVDRADAAHHLSCFSGRALVLNSAVVLAAPGGQSWRHVAEARLDVRPLSAAFIADYLDQEWPAISQCVGCFRIEGPGVQLFSAMAGDYFTILGMPLLPLIGALRARQILPA